MGLYQSQVLHEGSQQENSLFMEPCSLLNLS